VECSGAWQATAKGFTPRFPTLVEPGPLILLTCAGIFQIQVWVAVSQRCASWTAARPGVLQRRPAPRKVPPQGVAPHNRLRLPPSQAATVRLPVTVHVGLM